MKIKFEEIYAACLPILMGVGFHCTADRKERRFINAYQIYELLKQINSDFCDLLIKACGGEHLGKGAGSNVGPAQKIGQALGRNSNIETQYIDIRSMAIAGNIPSGEDCGLFRLKDPNLI